MDPEEDIAALGGRLKFARLKRGLHARELARKAKLKSESHVSLIESGRSFNDLDVLHRLAEALEVSLDWLVKGGTMQDALKEVAPKGPTFQHPASPTGTDGGK